NCASYKSAFCLGLPCVHPGCVCDGCAGAFEGQEECGWRVARSLTDARAHVGQTRACQWHGSRWIMQPNAVSSQRAEPIYECVANGTAGSLSSVPTTWCAGRFVES